MVYPLTERGIVPTSRSIIANARSLVHSFFFFGHTVCPTTNFYESTFVSLHDGHTLDDHAKLLRRHDRIFHSTQCIHRRIRTDTCRDFKSLASANWATWTWFDELL